VPHPELGVLTIGERLLVDRRRRGHTQADAARRWGISQSRYSRWERELDTPTLEELPYLWAPAKGHQLRGNERCLLYRRRAGLTQLHIATELGRCKMWVRQMERGEVSFTELLDYWEGTDK